jgi:hypothetical protein
MTRDEFFKAKAIAEYQKHNINKRCRPGSALTMDITWTHGGHRNRSITGAAIPKIIGKRDKKVKSLLRAIGKIDKEPHLK